MAPPSSSSRLTSRVSSAAAHRGPSGTTRRSHGSSNALTRTTSTNNNNALGVSTTTTTLSSSNGAGSGSAEVGRIGSNALLDLAFDSAGRRDANIQTEESALLSGREMAQLLANVQADLVQTKSILQTHYEANLQGQTQSIMAQLTKRWREVEKAQAVDLDRVRGALRQEEADRLAVRTAAIEHEHQLELVALKEAHAIHEKVWQEKLDHAKQDNYKECRRAEKWRFSADKFHKATKLMASRIRDKVFSFLLLLMI